MTLTHEDCSFHVCIGVRRQRFQPLTDHNASMPPANKRGQYLEDARESKRLQDLAGVPMKSNSYPSAAALKLKTTRSSTSKRLGRNFKFVTANKSLETGQSKSLCAYRTSR